MFSKKKENKKDEIFSVSDNVEDMFISNTNDKESESEENETTNGEIDKLKEKPSNPLGVKFDDTSDGKKSEEPKVEEKIDLSSLSRRDLKEYKRTGKIK